MDKKEKKSIWPKAAVIAFLAAGIVYFVMLNVEINLLSSYEKGQVLIAGENIVQGLQITAENVDLLFEAVLMEKSLIPKAAVTDKENLIGSFSVKDIDQGVVLTASMTEDITKQVNYLTEPVVAGFKADDLYQVVSGTLRSGDRIHIYSVDEELDAVILLWENVLVQQVFDNAGSQILPEDKMTAAGRVNIMLEKDSVERFYSELTTGSLRVVKVWDIG